MILFILKLIILGFYLKFHNSNIAPNPLPLLFLKQQGFENQSFVETKLISNILILGK